MNKPIEAWAKLPKPNRKTINCPRCKGEVFYESLDCNYHNAIIDRLEEVIEERGKNSKVVELNRYDFSIPNDECTFTRYDTLLSQLGIKEDERYTFAVKVRIEVIG